MSGDHPIPKASGEAHIRHTWGSRSLELDSDDHAVIGGIDREERVYDPDYAPDW